MFTPNCLDFSTLRAVILIRPIHFSMQEDCHSRINAVWYRYRGLNTGKRRFTGTGIEYICNFSVFALRNNKCLPTVRTGHLKNSEIRISHTLNVVNGLFDKSHLHSKLRMVK